MKGTCKICLKTAEMTYEHTPPNKAFNWWKQTVYSGKEIIQQIQSENLPGDFSNMKGKELQRGIGGYTLCQECNNNTGAWYANSFIDFVEQAMKAVVDQRKASGSLTIKFEKIKPSNIIKQVVCMMLSIANPNLLQNHPELGSFILTKEKKTNFKDVQIYAYIRMGRVMKYTGYGANISEGIFRQGVELTAIPFGFVLEIKPKKEEDKLTNISYFGSKFDYNEKADMDVTFPILETHTPYFMDYTAMKDFKKLRSEKKFTN